MRRTRLRCWNFCLMDKKSKMRGKKQKIHIPAAGFTDSTAGFLKYAGFHAKTGSRPAHRLVKRDDGIIFPILLLHALVNAVLELRLLPDEAKKRIYVTTDPKHGALRQMATEEAEQNIDHL